MWGFGKYKEIERIHLKFCNIVSNVKSSTSNAGVYGELGRYLLYSSSLNLYYYFKTCFEQEQ